VPEEKEAQDYLEYIKQFEEKYEGKKPPVQELPQPPLPVDTSKRP
jgi:hypothetical protein